MADGVGNGLRFQAEKLELEPRVGVERSREAQVGCGGERRLRSPEFYETTVVGVRASVSGSFNSARWAMVNFHVTSVSWWLVIYRR
jgi:hypothetical protein